MMVQAEKIIQFLQKLKETYNSKCIEFILPKSLLKMQNDFIQISIAKTFYWVLFPFW